MTLLVSETSLVANGPSFQMGGCSQIVLHDEDDSSEVLDIDEYIPNREVVNLENADVNIQGSTGVTIGPVTHVNVSGNVTIYSNGNVADDVEHKSIESGEHNKPGINSHDFKKNDLTFCCLQILYTHKTLTRNLAIFLTICLLCLIIAVILTQNSKTNDFNYNYTDPNYGHELGRHRIYYRVDWGGKPPKLGTKLLEHPVSLVIISHTLTLPCLSNVTCSSILRTIQTKHFAKPFLSADIGYNFLIGRDGGIYVGRGWDVRNFHRKISIGISFIGNFNFDEVNEEMIEAAEALIGQGLELRKISENYALVGENQTDPKMVISPGVNVYKVIRTWPRFYPKTMF